MPVGNPRGDTVTIGTIILLPNNQASIVGLRMTEGEGLSLTKPKIVQMQPEQHAAVKTLQSLYLSSGVGTHDRISMGDPRVEFHIPGGTSEFIIKKVSFGPDYDETLPRKIRDTKGNPLTQYDKVSSKLHQAIDALHDWDVAANQEKETISKAVG